MGLPPVPSHQGAIRRGIGRGNGLDRPFDVQALWINYINAQKLHQSQVDLSEL